LEYTINSVQFNKLLSRFILVQVQSKQTSFVTVDSVGRATTNCIIDPLDRRRITDRILSTD